MVISAVIGCSVISEVKVSVKWNRAVGVAWAINCMTHRQNCLWQGHYKRREEGSVIIMTSTIYSYQEHETCIEAYFVSYLDAFVHNTIEN